MDGSEYVAMEDPPAHVDVVFESFAAVAPSAGE
jgi:hypothetical protein